MKRMLLGCALLLLAGCGGFEEGPDYKSLYDSGTGLTFSLHERRASVMEKLGEQGQPTLDWVQGGDPGWSYLDGDLVIYYGEDDKANWILGFGERFSTLDFTPPMELYEAEEVFSPAETDEGISVLQRVYSSRGKRLEEGDPDGAYFTVILYAYEDFQSVTVASYR